MQENQSSRGPLAGLRVLDLTSVVMGPYCTQILCDLGAKVTKVESLEGDTNRTIGPYRVHGKSGAFLFLNRGKRSIAIDLRSAKGKGVFSRLLADADVLVHSIRPDGLKRLGIDYASVSQDHPGLIYCNLFGFARGGRYFGQPAYDDIVQAMSGLADLQTQVSGAPNFMATVLADKVGSLNAAYAILAAYIHRLNTGEGQEVDVSMFEAAAFFTLVEHISGAAFSPPLGSAVYSRVASKHRRPYQTKSGLLAAMVYTNKHWSTFAHAIGRADLLGDPRFTTVADRTRNTDDYYSLMQSIFLEDTAERWVNLLHSLEIPVAQVLSTDDLYQDPHLADIGFFQKCETPEDGTLNLPKSPVAFSKTVASPGAHGPSLGGDTYQILLDCGMDQAEIEDLIRDGVIVHAGAPAHTADTDANHSKDD